MNNNPNNRSIDRPNIFYFSFHIYIYIYDLTNLFISKRGKEFLLNFISKRYGRIIKNIRKRYRLDTVRDQLGRRLGDRVLSNGRNVGPRI